MLSLAVVVAAKALGAVAALVPESQEKKRWATAPRGPRWLGSLGRQAAEKTAMLSVMGSDPGPKRRGLKPRLKQRGRALLDDNVFRAAELNRARLCTIFCVAMSTQPVMDGAESLLAKLFRAGDPAEWGKFLSLLVYLSWGPILDSLNSSTIEQRQEDAAVVSGEFEFDPLSIRKGESKVRRRVEAIERQFEHPAKLAIFFYLLELVAANTSVLRESRMAISELSNVVMHEGDLHVLLEKSTAACLQVGCNVTDIGHDFDSIASRLAELLLKFDPSVAQAD
jgi:hypothetical protein